jgi:hypothetical protein
VLVHIDAHEHPDLADLLHMVLDADVPRSVEVPDRCVEMVRTHVLEDARELHQQSVPIGIGEELGGQQGIKTATGT